MEVTVKPFQILSLTTATAVYVLIILGGVVSSTGSGLACPDWPLCNGQVIPKLTVEVLIEFTHRLWTIVVTLTVIATMVFALKSYRWPSKAIFFSTLTFILLLGQIILGMLTVQTKTLPLVVISHLGMATLVFASALTASIVSFNPKEGA